MGNLNLRSMMEQKNKNVPMPIISEEELESRLNRNNSSGNTQYGEGYSKPYPSGGKTQKTQTQHRPTYSQPTSSPSYRVPNSRTGMSETAWNWVFSITEIVLDVIKGIMIVGGIISANLADFIMGSIGVSLIINTRISSLTFVNGFGFGSILSMGSSAIQIYMWSLIQKRGVTAKMLLYPKNWKNIPEDIRGFLFSALFLWAIDTILDVSPTFVLFTSENFSTMPTLYAVLVVSVMIIVIMLCGFAEILTSNMRGMLAGSK